MIGARIPGRWRHRQRRTAAEGARLFPEDPSGPGQRGRSAPASLGDGGTGSEELYLKECVCFRKTRRVQGNGGDRRLHLGYCSTNGEELYQKERGQIRKTGQAAGATQAIGARIPGRWRHRQRRTAAEGVRLFPEDPSGPGQRGRSAPASLGDGGTGSEELYLKECVCFRKTRRVQGNGGDWRLHLGYCSTNGEELYQKERGQIRKTGQAAGATQAIGARIPGRWRHRQRRTAAEGVRLFPEDPSGPGQRGRSAPASLGDGGTGSEELYLKECVCFRKTRRVQGNGGDRRLHLGYCSTNGEELYQKERGQIRKTGQAAGATQAIGARIPGRWRHRQRRTAAEGARLFPEDPSGIRATGAIGARISGLLQHRRRRTAAEGVRLFPEDPSGPGQRGRSAPASLGYCSTGGEELYLKECGQIRKTRRVQGNGATQAIGARIPGRWRHRQRRTVSEGAVCNRKTRRGQSNTGDQSAVGSYRKRKSADQCPYHNLRRQKFYMKRGC
nr:hypothetical protein [Bacillus amyloliquefaciens]